MKTHREDTKFNMPNLTSVERLSRFYEDDMNIFSLIIVKYLVKDETINVNEVIFSPIEFLDWWCLTVGARTHPGPQLGLHTFAKGRGAKPAES